MDVSKEDVSYTKQDIIDFITPKIEVNEGSQFVNFMRENKKSKEYLHMYRPPENCILIADEVHNEVKSISSLRTRCLMKYAMNSKFTILCTATPLSSPKLKLQVCILAKMLS